MKFPPLRRIVRAYLVSILFWYGIGLLMVLQNRPFTRDHLLSWLIALLGDAALRAIEFAIWTPPIFYLVGKYLGFSENRFRYLVLWAIGAVPFVLLQTSIVWVLVRPYDDALQKYVPRSFHSWFEMIRGGFADQVFIYLAVVAAAHAYHYLKRVRKQEREKYEYQQALAASELQALKMQLHPHFLFNTLHGIATLVDSNRQDAKEMIIKLSNLLRIALDRRSADLISLDDELKFVRDYLDIERMRFGSRLEVTWLIAPDVSHLLVPQLILQPLVENAIRYGVASARKGGWVGIQAHADDGVLIIQLRNNVGGRNSNGSGVGLRNAESRLKYLYADDASLRLAFSDDGIATLTLTLPALNSQSLAAQGATSKLFSGQGIHNASSHS